ITKLKQIWLPITISLLAGVVIGALSSISLAWLLDASVLTQLSFAPKSVTAPIAMGISERIGGLPALTAILVVATGIIGATIGKKLFEWLRIDDDSIKGVAM